MTFDGAVIGLIVRYEERVASMGGRIALPANHTIDGSLVCRTQSMDAGGPSPFAPVWRLTGVGGAGRTSSPLRGIA